MSASSPSYRYYQAAEAPPPQPAGEFRLQFWRPSWSQLLHPALPMLPFLAWSLLHLLHIFANRDFSVLLISQGSLLVHRACLFPAHFRFPFMAAGDLQIAGLWTHPALRGRGLGLLALGAILRRHGGRTLWYLVQEENVASIRLAEKAGLRLVGRGCRRKRLGLRALGYFHLDGRVAGDRREG
ncbi:GNAT family N-acetyltransferase [Geothrix sp. 21YS21S-2]|uniref:GNAT family N-acetyltransferase n=1 Tax=Geothrix sp. 21YS21S-2 TaxID=3068893 RepID=UPI0027B8A7D3|nr:GNAT family N-acetyltransferase [Geothrix sp. 21YS21S-2]